MNSMHKTAARFDEEVLRFCKHLDSRFPKDREYIVVNMALTDLDEFSFQNNINYQKIPTSFGYKIDELPNFLEDKKIIISEYSGLWFTNVVNIHKKIEIFCSLLNYDPASVTTGQVYKDIKRGNGNTALDKGRRTLINSINLRNNPIQITQKAREVKLIGEDENLEFFSNEDDLKQNSSNPVNMRGLIIALVDMKALRKYIQINEGDIPIYNTELNAIEYIGELLKISGPNNQATAKVLIDNINSIVSKKVVFELDNTNYEQKRKSHEGNLKKFHAPIDQQFNRVKKTISNHPVLSKCLVPVQHRGYGIFVNQSFVRNYKANSDK